MLDSLLAWLSQYRSVLSLIVAVFLPQLLPRIALLFRKDRRAPASHFSAPLPNTLKALLVIHSLYQAYRVLLPPYDVFTSNHIPLLVPQDVLRSVVLGSVASSTDLEVSTDAHPLVELLLQKLSRIEGRYLYSRYGHDTLLNCVWCSDSLDYLLYCLPRILGPYVLQAVLVGLMSLTLVGGVDAGRRALAWRAWVGWALVLGAVGEGTANYTWTIRAVQGQCTHLAPNIHLLRTICLLLLPLVYAILPLPPPGPSPHSLIPVLSNTQNTLRLASLSRSAIWRDPRLRGSQIRIMDEQLRAESSARSSAGVRNAMQDSALDEQRTRAGARQWISEGWASLVRIESSDDRRDR